MLTARDWDVIALQESAALFWGGAHVNGFVRRFVAERPAAGDRARRSEQQQSLGG